MKLRHGLVATWAFAALAVSSACAGQGSEPGTSEPGAEPGSPTATASRMPVDRQALLDRERELYGSLGALAMVRDGDEQWAGVSGAADLQDNEIERTTRFRVGSVTKPIVATLVLGALAHGEVSLDEIVSDLLPGVLRADPPITVRMLLDHTSGVFDYGNEGAVADIDQLPDPAMRSEARSLARRYADGEPVIAPDRLLVALAETHDRYFEPGSGYHYSNINYQLAGMVLEDVTRTSLADLLHGRIAEPLGLKATTLAPADTRSPDMRGYVPGPREGMFVDVTDDLIAFGNGGNGGVISTGDELLTIMQAIVSGRILPPDLVAAMLKMTTQSNSTYGLGLAKYDLSCGTFYGHEGRVNGTASIAIADTDGSRGVVIAFNLMSDTDPGLVALADGLLCR